VTEDGTSKFRDKGTNISENSKQTGKNPENSAVREDFKDFKGFMEIARFHAEADKEAERSMDWLDELEDSGRETRFSIANLPDRKAPNMPGKRRARRIERYKKKGKWDRRRKVKEGPLGFRKYMQDRMRILHNLEKELGNRGVAISEEDSIYGMSDTLAPRAQARMDSAIRKYFNPLFKTIAKMRALPKMEEYWEKEEPKLKEQLKAEQERIESLYDQLGDVTVKNKSLEDQLAKEHSKNKPLWDRLENEKEKNGPAKEQLKNETDKEKRKKLREQLKNEIDLKKQLKNERKLERQLRNGQKEEERLGKQIEDAKHNEKRIEAWLKDGTFGVIGRYLMAKHAPERNAFLKKRKEKEINEQADKDLKELDSEDEEEIREIEEERKIKLAKVNGSGSGMTDEEAAKIVKEFEGMIPKETTGKKKLKPGYSEKKLSKFERRAEKKVMQTRSTDDGGMEAFDSPVDDLNEQVKRINDFYLANLHAYGFITNEQYEEFKSRYEFFVPLKGWETSRIDEERHRYLDDSRGSGGRNSLVHEAKGRKHGSIADNPVVNMTNDMYRLFAVGEKNRMKAAAYIMAAQNREHADLYTVHAIRRRDLPEFEANEHHVEAWINGEKRVVYFGNEKIAQAINGARDHSIESADWYEGALSKFTRTMAAWNTSKNPEFIWRNTMRDAQQAFQRILIEDGKGMAARFTRMYYGAGKEVFLDVLYGRHSDGKTTGRDRNGRQKVWKNGDLIEEFMLSGAITGYIQSMKQEEMRKDIEKRLKRVAGQRNIALRGYDKVNGFLDGLAEISENSTRFAVYMTYRTSGYTVAEAARKAKEATVNFNRKGEIGGWAGSLWAYFNASVQAAENTLSLAGRNPGAFSLIAGIQIAKGIASYGLRYWLIKLIAGAGDDDGYKEALYTLLDTTDYILYTNSFFATENITPKLAMSHAWRPFHALGVMAAQMYYGDITQTEFRENMTSIVSSAVTPFDFDQSSSFAPTPFTPIYELMKGKNFMGAPLQKDMYTTELEENTKALHKAMPNTAPPAIWVSKTLARIAGFDPENPSKTEEREEGGTKELAWIFDVNPTRLEHVVNQYFGGLYRFGKNVVLTTAGLVEAGYGAATGKEDVVWFPYGWKNSPFGGSLVTDPVEGNYHQKRFYGMKDYLYGWDKERSENIFRGKKISGNTEDSKKRNNTLDNLLDKMYNYDVDAGIISDDIKYKQEQIKAKKETLKTVIPKTEKLRYEAEIKKLEDEIEAAKKKRIGLYRKAYGEMNPLFEKLKISYQ
jgi:hypothetical protein